MHWSMNNRWSFVEVRYRLLAFWRKYDCARRFSSDNRCGRHLFKSYLSVSNLFLMCLNDLWSCPSEGPLCYRHNSPLSNEMRSFDMQIYKFGTFLFLRIAPQPHAETLITTFPICFWLTRCLYASLAWSNEKTLSMTGLICRASKSRFISSNLEGRVC